MRKFLPTTLAAAAMAVAAPALADSVTIDLTHPIPTFHATEGDPMTPDLGKPWLDSVPIPSFGQQAVLAMFEFPTNQGHFDLGRIVLSEHHGTHLDTPGHYINNEGSMEAAGMAPGDRKLAHQLTSDDLIGPAVVIDISGRVQAELDKNGGVPSNDTAVTDFSIGSGNVVGADDIDAVADRIGDGVFLVLNLGWSDFFFQGTDFVERSLHQRLEPSGHEQGSRGSPDRDHGVQRGVKIAGIIADNIGIESGQSAIGDDDKWSNSWHAHVRLLQRGILFVENATNLGQVAMAGDCTVVVGAPKHVRGTGGPSRVMAICSG